MVPLACVLVLCRPMLCQWESMAANGARVCVAGTSGGRYAPLRERCGPQQLGDDQKQRQASGEQCKDTTTQSQSGLNMLKHAASAAAARDI